MEPTIFRSEIASFIESVLLQSTWYRKRSIKALRARQAAAVTNRRRAIDNAYLMSFGTVPSYFWLGYYCKLSSEGRLCITIRQKGDLPDVLKNDYTTTIFLSVKTGSQQQDVCIVKHGRQLEVPEIYFENLLSKTLEMQTCQFKLYFVTGRFRKRKHRITSWVVAQNAKTTNWSFSNWRLINKLSSKNNT